MTQPIQLKRISSITFSLSGEPNGPRVVEVVLNRSGGGAAVVKIGRDFRSHLPLVSDSISRMHAVIEVDRENTITVIDLGSGTKVDGKAINKADIRVGSIVEMGAITLIILSIQLEPVPEPKVEAPKPQVPTSERFAPPHPVIDQEPVISLENAPLEVLFTHYLDIARGVARRTTANLVRLARQIELEDRG